MSLATAELPTDMVSLRAFALACQSELKVAELSVQYKALEIEKLKDGYAGFAGLYNPARTKPGPIVEVACWARLPKVPCA
jgi:hypothetical protein